MFNRRSFLATTSAAALSYAAPAIVRGQNLNSKLQVVGVGCEGKGWSDISTIAKHAQVQFVGFCDIDLSRTQNVKQLNPDAPILQNFRELFDQLGDKFDAATVSTPDHMHAYIALDAMRRGKHVYCQKPLTHTVEEARRLTLAAKKHKVATQMGNQGRSHPQLRREVELVQAGVLGPVHEVHCWTDRPGRWWPQGLGAPAPTPQIPATLDWDLWLGVAQKRPYSSAYLPFNWRGFWDFGTGALGDMGCHLFNLPDLSLGIRDATHVEAWSEGMTAVSGPKASVVKWEIPATAQRPAFTLWWYDGGKLPPAALFPGAQYADNGVLFVGNQDVMLTNYNGGATFRSGRKVEDFKNVPETLPKCSNWDRCHYEEWIRACKGGPAALSDFSVAGPMTEVVLLGNVALRAGRPLVWDGAAMRVTNDRSANEWVRQIDRAGWTV